MQKLIATKFIYLIIYRTPNICIAIKLCINHLEIKALIDLKHKKF